MRLLRNLFIVKLEYYNTIKRYITEVMTTAQKLSDINAEVGDEFIRVILLSGLSEEYEPIITGLESSGTKITSELVKSKLIQKNA
jgi:hypothetical protein